MKIIVEYLFEVIKDYIVKRNYGYWLVWVKKSYLEYLNFEGKEDLGIF